MHHIKHFEVENWEKLTKKPSEIKLTEKNDIDIDISITSNMDTFNMLLLTYIKEMSNGRIITTNPNRLKHLLSILDKKRDTAMSWKYVDELLLFVTSSKELFFKWMVDNGERLVFNNILRLNKS